MTEATGSLTGVYNHSLRQRDPTVEVADGPWT